MKIIRFTAILGLLFLGFAAMYFVKCQLDICLVRNSFLDRIPPFNLLQNRNPNHIVYDTKPNVDLLPNDYPFLQGAQIFNPLWMQQAGEVTINYNDQNDHTSGIVITNNGVSGWAMGHKKLIQVRAGDVFSFSAWVKTSGKGVEGSISLITYDRDLKQLQWGYAKKSVASDQNWQYFKQEFKLPLDVKYIRFQLTGYGQGQTWFNDLKFNKS